MKNNDLQTESMNRLRDVDKALHLYFVALSKEGLLPMLEQKRNNIKDAVFDMTHEVAKLRFNRAAKDMGI